MFDDWSVMLGQARQRQRDLEAAPVSPQVVEDMRLSLMEELETAYQHRFAKLMEVRSVALMGC